MAAGVTWPDEVDEILAGDLVVAIGMPTRGGGVVLASVTPIGLRDRREGTVGFTSSLGFGRKLERIAADPRVTVAYHTRRHGRAQRPGLVVVQGMATVRGDLSDQERDDLKDRADGHIGQLVSGAFWDRWLRVYYYDRVLVTVTVHRILWWPDEDFAKEPDVLGVPLPSAAAPPQRPPRDATQPRVALRAVRRSVARRAHRLVGVLLADGMPLVLPVSVVDADEAGLVLSTPSTLVPDGGRRAGLLVHDFRPHLVGLSTATHTGWLDGAGGRRRWTPHTRHGFTAPANKTLLLLSNGLAARWGYRKAIREGRHLRYSAGGVRR